MGGTVLQLKQISLQCTQMPLGKQKQRTSPLENVLHYAQGLSRLVPVEGNHHLHPVDNTSTQAGNVLHFTFSQNVDAWLDREEEENQEGIGPPEVVSTDYHGGSRHIRKPNNLHAKREPEDEPDYQSKQSQVQACLTCVTCLDEGIMPWFYLRATLLTLGFVRHISLPTHTVAPSFGH
jgi:hypothetical protein